MRRILPRSRNRVVDSVTASRSTAEVAAYREAAAWIREHVPDGECVFTADWDDYPYLFFFDPNHTYLVGLDPSFMRLWDEPLYRQWTGIRDGRFADGLQQIVDRFESRVAVVTKDYGRLITRSRADARVGVPVDNPYLVVLDLSRH